MAERQKEKKQQQRGGKIHQCVDVACCLLFFSSHFQDIVRTYGGRQFCLSSADLRKTYLPLLDIYPAVTFHPTTTDGGHSCNTRERTKPEQRKKETPNPVYLVVPFVRAFFFFFF